MSAMTITSGLRITKKTTMKMFYLLAVVGIVCAVPQQEGKRQLVPANTHCNFQAPNPCTAGKTGGAVFFPHPNDNTKFIQCNIFGEMYIIQCPAGKHFNAATVSCVSQSQHEGHVSGGTLHSNPCTTINLSHGKIYFAYPGDVHKFIECDLAGNANILACPSNLVWDETILSCAYSFTAGQPLPNPDLTALTGTGVSTNPCKTGMGFPQYYAHPNPGKFIQCDNTGNAFVLSCPAGLVWNTFSNTCIYFYDQTIGTY